MEEQELQKWILAYMSFRFFLAGVEEFIILPTLLGYIQSLDGSMSFLGLVAAAYAMGVSVFTPFFKILLRKWRHVYIITVLASFVKLAASVMYSMPITKLFPLFARIISGLADSCDEKIYKEMSRYTNEGDRMGYGEIFNSIFTLGAVFGAVACSSLTLHQYMFGWSKWYVGIGNSPGIILAVIWFVFFTLTLYLPCTFGVKVTAREDDQEEEPGEEDSEDARTVDSNSTQESTLTASSDSRVACLLYLTFMTMFFASCASFFPSPIAIKLFHLKVAHVKLLFVNGTLALLLLSIVLFIGARIFEEKTLLLSVLFLQLPSLLVLIFISYLWTDIPTNYSYMLLVYICLGLPYFGFSICGSLIQKFTDPEKFKNFYQPLFIALIQLAIISSRVIGGFIFRETAFFVFSVCLLLMWLLGVIWFAVIYRKLAPRKNRLCN